MTKTRLIPFSLEPSLPSLLTTSLNNTSCGHWKYWVDIQLRSAQMSRLTMPHLPQEGMKRFTLHLARFSGETRGPMSGPKVVWGKRVRRLVWLLMWLRGGVWVKGPLLDPSLEWCELPRGTKGGSSWGFLPGCVAGGAGGGAWKLPWLSELK